MQAEPTVLRASNGPVQTWRLGWKWFAAAAPILAMIVLTARADDNDGFGPRISVPRDLPKTHLDFPPTNRIDQTWEQAMHKSVGCLQCHKGIENPSMHVSKNVILGCTDCHGGNPIPGLTEAKAHVSAAASGILAEFGQSERFGCVAEPRIARVHPVHQPRRLARGRTMPAACAMRRPCDTCEHSMMNHGAMLLGRGALQQRRVSLEKLSLRPGLWSERRAA